MPHKHRIADSPVSAGSGAMAKNDAVAKKDWNDLDGCPVHDAPPSVERTEGNRKYKLICVQQPKRARMCGFGDKDRRPITPPPCVRLCIIDQQTGKEVDCNDIEHQMYVVAVDLWSFDGLKEVNLVKHSQNSPSISSTTQQSYRDVIEQGNQPYQPPYPAMQTGYAQPPLPYQQAMPDAYTQQAFHGQGYYAQHSGQYPYPHQAPQFRPDLPSNIVQLPSQSMYNSRYPQDVSHQRLSHLSQQPNGMYTRNLIGSLCSSASRLFDTDDKLGIWFILQDLSVRTEGFFRLRFSFVNVGVTGTKTNGQTSDPMQVNKGKAPILAQCFSEPFQVYSAKKFPGVCESTPLSKCFAGQGIKIPIRKEGQEGKRGKQGSDEEDEILD